MLYTNFFLTKCIFFICSKYLVTSICISRLVSNVILSNITFQMYNRVSSQCIQNHIKIRRLVTTNAVYIKYSMCRVINRFQYRKVCQEDMRNDKKKRSHHLPESNTE